MNARRHPALAVAIVVIFCAGCAPVETTKPSQVPPPRGEWKVAAAAISRTHPWKGIVVGQTTRQQVDLRFPPLSSAAGGSRYQIDRIETAISYEKDGRVASIDLPAAVAIADTELIAKYGPPDRTRSSGPYGPELDYDRAGLTVAIAQGTTLKSGVRLREARGPVWANSDELFDQLVPIRPPLDDLQARRGRLASALGETGYDVSPTGSDSERAQAEQTYESIYNQGLVIKQAELQKYVSGVMARLASVTPGAASDWHTAVMQGSAPQAMNLGGGYVLVTQGCLEELNTEGQFAYVLAHEMAHQLKGHLAVEQGRQSVAAALVIAAAIAAGAFGGQAAERAAVNVGVVASQAALAPFSREQESDADLTALSIMEAADYDPRQAIPVMDRLTSLRDRYGQVVSILSTHPEPETRRTEINERLTDRSAQEFSGMLVTTQEFIAIRSQYGLNSWE